MIAPVSPSFLADFATPTAPITLARATRTPDRKPDRYLDGYGFWQGADVSEESVALMEKGNTYGLYCIICKELSRQEYLYDDRHRRDIRRLDRAKGVERIATLKKRVERFSMLAARSRQGTLFVGVRSLCRLSGKGRATIHRRLSYLEQHGFISTRVPGMQSIIDQKAGRIARKASGRIRPMEITVTLVPAQMRPKRGTQPMDSPRVHQNSPVRTHGESTSLYPPKTEKEKEKKAFEKEEIRGEKDKDNAATPSCGPSPALDDATPLETDPVDREGDELRELASQKRQAMELGGDPESDRAKGLTYRNAWQREQAAYDRSKLAAADDDTESQAVDSLAELRAGRAPLPAQGNDPKQGDTLSMLRRLALQELTERAKKVAPERIRKLSKSKKLKVA